MPKWLPVFVLPNVYLKEPVDGEMAAIANCSDLRIQQILSGIPVLAQFVERFGRPFGGSVNPSMLIVREDAPKTFLTGEAVRLCLASET